MLYYRSFLFLFALVALLSGHAAQESDPTSLCRLFKDGTQLRYPGSCTDYIKCSNQSGVVLSCVEPRIFDTNKQSCIEISSRADENACPHPCEGNDGKWVADPMNCHGFFYCSKGIGAQGYCPEGYHFQESKQMCTFETTSDCLQIANICDIAPDKSKFRNEKDCSAYYECSGGKRSSKTCTGKYFDVEKGSCVEKHLVVDCVAHPKPKNVCGTDKKPDKGNMPDGATCRGYFVCRDLGIVPDVEPSWRQCPVGTFFDKSTQACTHPTQAVCTHNRCEGRGTMLVTSSSHNCRSYIVCKDNFQVEQKVCPGDLFFDEAYQACIPNIVYDKCCDGQK